MSIESWLRATIADAETRGLPELKPLLEGLAQATRVLRNGDFNDTAVGRRATESRQAGPLTSEGHRH
jgi:hypothetical protein